MLISKVICELCGREFKAITHTHTMKEHNMSLKEYMKSFPDSPIFESPVEKKGETRGLLLDVLHKTWIR